MKNETLVIIGTYVLSIILVGCGILMAFKQIHGWGWLIFLGVLVYGESKDILKLNRKNKKDERTEEKN
jgi:hypothetical protein